MDARRLNIGIRIAAERSKALREALRRVAGGDRTLQEPGFISKTLRSSAVS